MPNLLKQLLFISILNLSWGFERDLTINVDPGKLDCFYQKATEGESIDIEYQVIDGVGGALDVAFTLSAPGGRILVSLNRRQSGVAHAVVSDTGDHRFCFDNTHSTISRKTVYFDVLIDHEDDNSDEDNDNKPEQNQNEADVPSDDIGTTLIEVANRVGLHLTKARRMQEAVAARSSRDDHAAARSLSRVTVYSASNAIAIFTIGIFQVILLRSLFDEKSRVHALWKKVNSYNKF